jgi:hypothetical protein
MLNQQFVELPPIRIKAEESAKYEKQMQEFLNAGGKVQHIPIGVGAEGKINFHLFTCAGCGRNNKKKVGTGVCTICYGKMTDKEKKHATIGKR